MQADEVIFEDDDQSFTIQPAILGISALKGKTRRGPVDDPSLVISTIPVFRKLFGYGITTTDFPALVERIINKGGQVRISRVAHYTDPATASTLSATKTTAVNIIDTSGTPKNLFTVQSKYPGADYNNVKVNILAPSNGNSAAGYFNLQVILTGDEDNATELYPNMQVVGNAVPANQSWADSVNADSYLIKIGYLDLSATSGQLITKVANYSLSGASDGGSVVAADYIGDQTAQTGFFSFDAYDDMMQVAAPEVSDENVNIGLAAYAEGRQDLEALMHVDETLTTVAAIQGYRNATAIDTKYASFFAGGIVDATGKNISEIADVINIANFVDKKYGPWFSDAGTKRGVISNVKGVINNFGTKAQYPQLNQLVQSQVNLVVNASGKVYLKSQSTAQVASSKASYRNVVRGLIYLKKSLRPIAEGYLEEPMDIPTFLSFYQDVEPFMDNLTVRRFFTKGAGQSKKGWDWIGDQYAPDLLNLSYNSITDINNGLYKVKLIIYPIGVINGITISIGIDNVNSVVSLT